MTDKIGSIPKFQMDQRKTGKKKKKGNHVSISL